MKIFRHQAVLFIPILLTAAAVLWLLNWAGAFSFFNGNIRWMTPEVKAYTDPLNNLKVFRLTSDPAHDEVFYQYPKGFGGTDNTLFAFMSQRRRPGPGLYILNLVTEEIGALLTPEHMGSLGNAPSWTPDGREIFVGGHERIIRIDVASGKQTRLKAPEGMEIWNLVVSPDGENLVFIEKYPDERGGGSGQWRHRSLSLIKLDGSGYRELYRPDGNIEVTLSHPAWMSDNLLAFLTRGPNSTFSGDYNKPYVLNIDTGELSRLPYQCSHYDPHPTQPLLLCGMEAYILNPAGEKIYTYDVHGHAAWSPDGVNFLATGSNGGGEVDFRGIITLLNMVSNQRVELAYHHNPYWDPPGHRGVPTQPNAQWLPDQWIIWTGLAEGAQPDIFGVKVPPNLLD